MDESKSGDRFGLTEVDLASIILTFTTLPQIESVLLFGSRAMGNFKNTSDIDLCLKGFAVDYSTCSKLRSRLEELPMPYFFDIVNYNSLQNMELKDHIDEDGKEIYQAQAINSPNPL
jgi:predicted nucleotidyltransferase